jgi:hypothetical protein
MIVDLMMVFITDMEKPPLLGIKYGDATINEDGYMMI